MSYGHHGISGVDTVGAAIGAAVAGALVGIVILMVYGAKFALHPVLRAARGKWQEVAAPRSPLTADSLAPSASATPAPTASPADRIRSVELASGGAILHMRFFGDEVRAHVVLRSSELVASHGKRVDLPPANLAGTSAQAVEAALIQQATTLLAPEPEIPQEGAISSTGIGNESVQDNPVPPAEQGSAEPELPKVAPRKTPHMRVPKSGLVSYRGVLVRAGVERRTGVADPYDCYCVTISDAELGHDQQLWGTDLERAVEDSGAEIGDAVRVALIGETPVHYRGRTTHKKIWSVERLAA